MGKVRAFPFVCLFALCAAGCDSAPKGAEGTGETAVGMRWAADQKSAFDLRNGVPAAFDLGDSLFLEEFDVVMPIFVDMYDKEGDDEPGISRRKGASPRATLIYRAFSRYGADLRTVYAAELARRMREFGKEGTFTGRLVLTVALFALDSGRAGVAEAHVDSSSIRDAAFAEIVRKESLRWIFPCVSDYMVSIPIDFVRGKRAGSGNPSWQEEVPEEKYPDGTYYFASGFGYLPDGTIFMLGEAIAEVLRDEIPSPVPPERIVRRRFVF